VFRRYFLRDHVELYATDGDNRLAGVNQDSSLLSIGVRRLLVVVFLFFRRIVRVMWSLLSANSAAATDR
jgi:hypothetical protein